MSAARRLTPLAFAAMIALVYLLLSLPILLHDGRDLSFFVVAGDHFVDPQALLAPIYVWPHSVGYDGQFFYRLAVAPFSFANPAAGIRFDVPVYRSQRFLYPLLAWLAAAGQPGAAAAALFAVNIAGIGAIAAAALCLVRRLALPDTTAWAIVAWPGLLVTLTHDTAEIVSAGFLLSALAARAGAPSRARLPLYVLLGAAATLARETASPVFAGLFLLDLLNLRRGGAWFLMLADVLAVTPLLAEHAIMPILWHQTAAEGVLSHDFGWPLMGPVRALVEKVDALARVMPHENGRGAAALNVVALALLLLVAARAVLAVLAAIRIWRGAHVHGVNAWIPAAWFPTALLMAVLREGDGAFATPFEYCRAFSEFWPLSCLVIAAASPARRAPTVLALGLAASVIAFTYTAFGAIGL